MSAMGSLYKVVAASQSTTKVAKAGTYEEYIARLVVVPTSTTVGVVQLWDGSGTGSVAVVSLTSGFETELHPYVIDLECNPAGVGEAASGFHVVTGVGVTVTVIGKLA